MASIFPSALGTLATPQPTDRLNNPSHSTLHQNENNEILQIERFIGTIPASAIGTLIYDIRSPDSNGGGHIQTASKGGTGQTTYAKGDILVASSSSVLTKLSAASTQGYALVTDSTQATGLKWGLPGNVPSVIVVTSSSVYTISANRSYIRVQGIAAGGGTSAAGGGAGGYGESIIPASSIISSVAVTIGSPGGINTPGGNTIFGTFMSMQGGGGTNNTTAGVGGSVSGAQIRIPGGTGQSLANGAGGAGFLGGAGTFGAGGQSGSPSAVGGWVSITEY